MSICDSFGMEIANKSKSYLTLAMHCSNILNRIIYLVFVIGLRLSDLAGMMILFIFSKKVDAWIKMHGHLAYIIEKEQEQKKLCPKKS